MLETLYSPFIKRKCGQYGSLLWFEYVWIHRFVWFSYQSYGLMILWQQKLNPVLMFSMENMGNDWIGFSHEVGPPVIEPWKVWKEGHRPGAACLLLCDTLHYLRTLPARRPVQNEAHRHCTPRTRNKSIFIIKLDCLGSFLIVVKIWVVCYSYFFPLPPTYSSSYFFHLLEQVMNSVSKLKLIYLCC